MSWFKIFIYFYHTNVLFDQFAVTRVEPTSLLHRQHQECVVIQDSPYKLRREARIHELTLQFYLVFIISLVPLMRVK